MNGQTLIFIPGMALICYAETLFISDGGSRSNIQAHKILYIRKIRND